MPTPEKGERKDDFINRCIPIVIDDGTAKDASQAFAVCSSMYEEKKMQNCNFKNKNILFNTNTQDMNNVLDKIREILGINKQNFEEVKDKEGNLIKIEKYEIGGKAELISTDGSLIALTDGEYELEDGRKFTVTAGLISAIDEAPKVEDKPAEEIIQPIANADSTPEIEDAAKGDVDGKIDGDIEARLGACETKLEDISKVMNTILSYMEEMATSTSEFKEIKKKFQKEKEELTAKIAELEVIPAGNPVEIKAAKIEKVKIENKDKAGKLWDDDVNYAERYQKFQELTKKK